MGKRTAGRPAAPISRGVDHAATGNDADRDLGSADSLAGERSGAKEGQRQQSHGPGAGSLASLWPVIEKVIAPGTLLIALAYYFGRQLTYARSAYFGVDASLLGFSVQDYIVRSADALFVPLAVFGVLGLVFGELHIIIRRRFDRRGATPAAKRFVLGLTVVGLTLLAVGTYGVFSPFPISLHYLVVPLCPAVGALLVSYSAYLRRRLASEGDKVSEDAHASVATTRKVFAAGVVAMSLFWAASEYAAALGRGRAQALAGDLSRQPGATVFSERRLAIAGPGVSERRVTTPRSFFRYRYDGLRLFIRSGGHYFLLPGGWTRRQGSAIILSDTPTVRFEFVPPYR